MASTAPDFNRDTAYVRSFARQAGVIPPRLGEKAPTFTKEARDMLRIVRTLTGAKK